MNTCGFFLESELPYAFEHRHTIGTLRIVVNIFESGMLYT